MIKWDLPISEQLNNLKQLEKFNGIRVYVTEEDFLKTLKVTVLGASPNICYPINNGGSITTKTVTIPKNSKISLDLLKFEIKKAFSTLFEELLKHLNQYFIYHKDAAIIIKPMGILLLSTRNLCVFSLPGYGSILVDKADYKDVKGIYIDFTDQLVEEEVKGWLNE